MKLSKYREILKLNYELLESIKAALKLKSVKFDKVQIIEVHETFVVLNVTHNANTELTYMNIWDIIEDKFCTNC